MRQSALNVGTSILLPCPSLLVVRLPGLLLAAVTLSACGDSPATNPSDEVAVLDGSLRVWKAEIEQGVVLHYTFEDHDGTTVFDMSGNGRDATVHGVTFSASPWGGAGNFDGVDDYLSLVGPRAPALYGGVDGAMTMHARVRVDDTSHLNTLCFGCGPWNLTYVGTSAYGPRVLSAVHNQTTSGKIWPQSSASLQDDTWVDVTMVVEGSEAVRYYLDCELDTEMTSTHVGLHDYSYSAIGQAPAGTSSWFGGEIDDLRIWNRALSQEEIDLACADPVDRPCSGAPEASSLGIAMPTPPQPYTPPDCAAATVACVEDAAELQAAVNAGTYDDIILGDGLYDHADMSGDWLQLRGQNLWAANVGGAHLNFGVHVGGNNGTYDFSGAQFHGLVFDISDVANAPGTMGTYGAIYGWGDAMDLLVQDCTFDGNGVVYSGIYTRALEGLVVERVQIEDFLYWGIAAQNAVASHTPVAEPMVIEDVAIYRIGDASLWDDYGTIAGRQEVGIQLGDWASVSNVFIRDVRWAGILLGLDSDGTLLEYIDVDRVGVGHAQDTYPGGVAVYSEMARNTEISNFCIGPNTRVGYRQEWDKYNPNVQTQSQCESDPNCGVRNVGNVAHNGVIESSEVGFHAGQGTVDTEAYAITFRNYTQAGIMLYNNLTTEVNWPVYDGGGAQHDNVFDQACGFTRSAWGASPIVCE